MRTMLKKKWTIQKLVMFLQMIILPILGIYLLYLRDWNTLHASWVFSIALDIMGMVIALLLFLSVVKDTSDISYRTGCFSYLISICSYEMFFSLCTWLADGIPSLSTLNMLCNVIPSALSALMLCITWQYLVEVADVENAFIDKTTKLINIVGILTILAAIGNYFGHYYFYVDDMGVYHRGPYYISRYFFTALMFVLVVRMVVFMDLSRSKKRALMSFALMPITGILLQTYMFGVSLTYPSFLCALIFIYSNVFAEQKKDLVTKNLEIMSAENRLLMAQQAHARIDTELNMATAIQTKSLPQTFPPFPDIKKLDLFASMTPAKEVGGDFYDFFCIDEDHIGLVIADVSGKGVPAALYMMISKTLLRCALKEGRSPAKALAYTNQQFCESESDLEMFVTVWAGILELSTNTITAANAGHEYPAIKRAGGNFELYKDKHGFVVGGMAGISYKEYQLVLNPGDTLFVYTDGVPEACDEELALFGLDRMLEALNEDPDRGSKELIQGVATEIQHYIGTADQFDDITMMCLRIK